MSSVDARNRLDQIVAEHDLDYANAKCVTDYWKADAKLMFAIDILPEPKTIAEKLVCALMEAKRHKYGTQPHL